MFMNRHALTKVNSPGGGNGDSQKRLSYSPGTPPACKRTGFSSVFAGDHAV
jgi:hypothetical protein